MGKWRLRAWQTILLFGILQCSMTALGVYFFDYFAGSATVGFGKQGDVPGTGMFFVYMTAYFNTLIVLVPMFLLRFFGVGALVYLPYALTGLYLEYYYEWVKVRSLVSPFAVAGWCAFGVLTGLSADLANRFLPRPWDERLRAALTGTAMGAASYALTFAALAFFYVNGLETGPGTFAGLTYFGLPWLLASGAFGGYTSWAIAKDLA